MIDELTQEDEEYAFVKQAGVKPITRDPATWHSYYECGNCGNKIRDINHDYCTLCGYYILWSEPRCLTGYPGIDEERGDYKYVPDEEALQSQRRCAIRAMLGATPRFTQGIKGIAYDSWDCGNCGACAVNVSDNYCWKCGSKHHWDILNTFTGKRKQHYAELRGKARKEQNIENTNR